MIHVPYKSAPPAVQDVLGGRVSMLFTDMATGWPLHQQGSLRGLATTRLKRSTLVPELPTLDESGVKGFDMDSWAGLFAPAKTPPAVVGSLHKATVEIFREPGARARVVEFGGEVVANTPAEFRAFIKNETEHLARVVQGAGIRLD
jgi:tripartite-type tricarboxylate transporter receptor subunit TctC